MHAQDVWQECLSVVRGHLTSPTTRAWFEETKALELTTEKLTLRAPHAFAKDWLQQRYGVILSEALATAAGPGVTIEILGDDSSSKALTIDDLSAQAAIDDLNDQQLIADNQDVPANTTANISMDVARAGLSAKYKFDNFVIGSSNRFTHAACMNVAEAPAAAYNPLFIYGGSGLGKTHLLHAIGRHSMELYPGLRCLYVSTETFVNELINAIKEDKTEPFKRKYRATDLLLVDDIQFLENKERSQEEFFHTFNSLYSANKQIVIASDRPARDIATIEDRLKTRFDSGLTADIQPPDLETRIAILRKLSERDSMDVPHDVHAFLASRIQHSVRELEGALIRVCAYAKIHQRVLDLELAESVIGHLLPEADAAPADPNKIISEVASYFRVTPDQLRSTNRERNVTHARHIAMYLVRENTDFSLPKVGAIFCRDHTTVMHAIKRINELITNQRNVYLQVQELTTRVKSKAS